MAAEQKNVEEFIELLTKILEKRIDLIYALAKIMGVRLVDGCNNHKEGDQILEDLIVQFGCMSRADRRDLLKIMRTTVKRGL